MGVNSQNATIKKGSFTTEGYQGWEDWWNTRALWVWECYTGIEYTNGSRTDETRWIRWRWGRERTLNTKNAFHDRWCLPREGDVCLGVSALWVCPGHVYPRGGVYTPLDQEADTPRQTPPSHCMLGYTPCPLHVGIHTPLPIACWDRHPLWTEWHTGIKTLPFPKLRLQTVTRGLLRRCIKIIRDGSYRHFETCMSLKHMHMMCVFYCIFTPKPPYSIAIGKLQLAIWDTSF